MTEREQPAALTEEEIAYLRERTIAAFSWKAQLLFRRLLAERAQLRADLERAWEGRKQYAIGMEDTVAAYRRERDAARAGYDEAIAATKAAWTERDAALAKLAEVRALPDAWDKVAGYRSVFAEELRQLLAAKTEDAP